MNEPLAIGPSDAERDPRAPHGPAVRAAHDAGDAAERHFEREIVLLGLGDLAQELEALLLAGADHLLHGDQVAARFRELELEPPLALRAGELDRLEALGAVGDEADHRAVDPLAPGHHAAADEHRVRRLRAELDEGVLALHDLGHGELHVGEHVGEVRALDLVVAPREPAAARHGHHLVAPGREVGELELALAVRGRPALALLERRVLRQDRLPGPGGALVVVDHAQDAPAGAQREHQVLALFRRRELDGQRRARSVLGVVGDELQILGGQPFELEATLVVGGRRRDQAGLGPHAAQIGEAALAADRGARDRSAARRDHGPLDRRGALEHQRELRALLERHVEGHHLGLAVARLLREGLPVAGAQPLEQEAAVGILERARGRLGAEAGEHAAGLRARVDAELGHRRSEVVDHAAGDADRLLEHQCHVERARLDRAGARAPLDLLAAGLALGLGQDQERALAEAVDGKTPVGVGLSLAVRAVHGVEGLHPAEKRRVELHFDLDLRRRRPVGPGDAARDARAGVEHDLEAGRDLALGELERIVLVEVAVGLEAQHEHAGSHVQELEGPVGAGLALAHLEAALPEHDRVLQHFDLDPRDALPREVDGAAADRAAEAERELERHVFARGDVERPGLGRGHALGRHRERVALARLHAADLERVPALGVDQGAALLQRIAATAPERIGRADPGHRVGRELGVPGLAFLELGLRRRHHAARDPAAELGRELEGPLERQPRVLGRRDQVAPAGDGPELLRPFRQVQLEAPVGADRLARVELLLRHGSRQEQLGRIGEVDLDGERLVHGHARGDEERTRERERVLRVAARVARAARGERELARAGALGKRELVRGRGRGRELAVRPLRRHRRRGRRTRPAEVPSPPDWTSQKASERASTRTKAAVKPRTVLFMGETPGRGGESSGEQRGERPDSPGRTQKKCKNRSDVAGPARWGHFTAPRRGYSSAAGPGGSSKRRRSSCTTASALRPDVSIASSQRA